MSCKDDPCDDIFCYNDGYCVDGTCECPLGYTGSDCGFQVTPKKIVLKGISNTIKSAKVIGYNQELNQKLFCKVSWNTYPGILYIDIPKDEIVVIVDGANDIKLFDICNLGIAYRAQDLVKDLATTTLEEKDLTKIIPIINKHYSIELPLPVSS